MNEAMSNSMLPSGAASTAGVWLSPQVVAALLALAGVIVGLVARDVVMATYLAKRKRTDELADKEEAAGKAHQDLVRLYADPLKDAVTSLKYRLREIVEEAGEISPRRRPEYSLPRIQTN